jgi:hypothetical protein
MIIVSIFSKHEDFIELQYNSIKKHIKNDYEYVVLNNAATETQIKLNEEMCGELGVKCIRIDSNQFKDPSNIAGEALNQMLGIFKGETIFKIDSDMFFMSDIDLKTLLGENDILYLPAFSGNPLKEWMWSGVFGLNTNIVNTPINCRPSNGFDTFGESRFFIDNHTKRIKKLNLFGLQTFENGILTTSCNNDCIVQFNEKGEIIFTSRKDYLTMYNITNLNLYEKYNDIIKYLVEYNFPQPYLLDIITINGVDTIFHFKSASWESHPDEHTINKKMALKKLLTDDTN